MNFRTHGREEYIAVLLFGRGTPHAHTLYRVFVFKLRYQRLKPFIFIGYSLKLESATVRLFYIYLDQLSLKSQRPTCTDEAAGRKQVELEKERQADTARTDLRDIDFATNLNGPISGTSSAPFARNELEADMWRNYSTM
jgi:hypothetical protein